MKITRRSLKERYSVFVGSIILTIIATQAVVQYDLKQQNEDARLINLAGRQRAIGQRITKIVLYLKDDINATGEPRDHRMDTLRKALESWHALHQQLLGRGEKNSKAVDSLLSAATPHLEATARVCRSIIADPNKAIINSAVDEIAAHELPYYLIMDTTVHMYQVEAEQKLTYLKRIELFLAFVSLVILLLQFFLFFLPILNKLRASNKKQSKINKQLAHSNHDLESAQEEVRAYLDHIETLRKDLESSERQYRGLVESATDMIYELDETGRFAFANQVLIASSGYDREHLQSMPYYDLVHPEDRKYVVGFYLDQQKRKEETSFLKLRIVTKDGKVIWVGQNVRMFYNEKGVFKVSVVARNINKLREAEMSLEESEKLFRTLAEFAPVGIFRLDAEGRSTFVNKRWCMLSGQDEEHAKRDGWTSTIAAEDRPTVIKTWEASMAAKGEFGMEFRFGSEEASCWVSGMVIALNNERGEVTGYLGTVSDITQRKLFEHQLIVAKEKAESATRAKSQFLSMMSHEIRTPMNAIIGLASLLLQEKPRGDQRENLRLLRFSGESLLAILNDILDFSKIEVNKVVLESIDFDVRQHLADAVKMMQPAADDKGIQLKFHFDKTLPTVVKTDPVRLNQVVNNLLSNAIKFTQEGNVQFSVTPGDAGGDPAEVAFLFEVSDTGIGIPPDKLDTIFEGFSQAASDTTRKYGGTGLGLTISRRLVQLMGGDIKLHSELGKGSTFSFKIRLKRGQTEAKGRHHKESNVSGALKARPITLLLDRKSVV